jgi:hypothetical protein
MQSYTIVKECEKERKKVRSETITLLFPIHNVCIYIHNIYFQQQ